mmetsp:Transcript_6771/g.41343  ORF Transcript_6771/g.41343 Transcript_6771/m.41343 type:complete len:103 (+) Transcript_6771:2415-2723(+)
MFISPEQYAEVSYADRGQEPGRLSEGLVSDTPLQNGREEDDHERQSNSMTSFFRHFRFLDRVLRRLVDDLRRVLSTPTAHGSLRISCTASVCPTAPWRWSNA